MTLAGPVALLFPGQGVQKPGMGRRVHDRYPAAQAAFQRAEEIVGMPVRRLCFEGPEEELNRTEMIQPCIMACCWAAYEVWRESYGLEHVTVMAGHSLGEFTALAAADSVSWEAALLLVKQRGILMARAALDRPGGMIAIVGLPQDAIDTIRAKAGRVGDLFMANRNADDQFVLSGEIAAVREAERLALDLGARRALILTIPFAAHSPLMEQAGAAFRRLIERLPIGVPSFPILANATGEALSTIEALRNELAGHLQRPVDWTSTMLSMRALQVRTVVELGPGRVLASLAAKHIPNVDTWNAEELFIDFADPVPAT